MPYVVALVITLILEVPIYALVLAVARLAPVARLVVAGVLINVATHPIVWLVLSNVPAEAYWPWFVACELFAWLGEALLLWLWLRRDPLVLVLTALLANTASILAGFLLL